PAPAGVAPAPAAVAPGHESTGLIRYDTGNAGEVLHHFFLESAAHLTTVEEAMLRLESEPTDTAALRSAFGALHSLKGVTGFVDLTSVRDLVHESEALVEAARRRAGGATRLECDLLLRSVDQARAILERIRTHAEQPGAPFPPLPPDYTAHRRALQAAIGQTVSRVFASGSEPAGALVAAGSQPLSAAPAPAGSELADAPTFRTAAPGADTPIAGSDEAGQRPSQTVVLSRRETDAPSSAATLVRVQVEKLDRLVDAIGELAITQIQIFQHATLRENAEETLARNISLAGKITRELQTLAMQLRMVPLKETFGRMARLARDQAHRQNKDLAVTVEGEDTELDKTLTELLLDPLTHLVRNAVDHGVDAPERRKAAGKSARATLRLAAFTQGSHVVVEVADDGAGLDLEGILQTARRRRWVADDESPPAETLHEFIFEPGFSTARQVTDISGRGIGLDVVRARAASVGGGVQVVSRDGQGTTFRITLPLTLALVDGLLVQCGAEQYIVPMGLVLESLRPQRTQLGSIHERGRTIEWRGQAYPLLVLADFAGLTGARQDPCEAIVILVDCRGERLALQVDEILGVQQVVTKSLGERLKGLKGFSGGAILGDGRVRLILDIAGMLAATRRRTFARAG
ncbi:MAG: chemotaxis protein CheA, partial [Planctomycetota bacterium]